MMQNIINYLEVKLHRIQRVSQHLYPTYYIDKAGGHKVFGIITDQLFQIDVKSNISDFC